MKRFRGKVMLLRIAIAAAVCAGAALAAAPCHAADWLPVERATWDLAMRLINFGILVYFMNRYLRKPLVDFVTGRRAEVAGVFERMAQEQKSLEAQREEQDRMLQELDDKIESIRAFYHQIGMEEKQKILRQAEAEKQRILEDAQMLASMQFEQAKKRFRAEVVELAVQMAEERLRKKITKKDQKMLFERYIEQLSHIEAVNL